MIFPCLELFLVIFQVFQSLWKPCSKALATMHFVAPTASICQQHSKVYKLMPCCTQQSSVRKGIFYCFSNVCSVILVGIRYNMQENDHMFVLLCFHLAALCTKSFPRNRQILLYEKTCSIPIIFLSPLELAFEEQPLLVEKNNLQTPNFTEVYEKTYKTFDY